jgi:hypothetical protein
VSATRLLLQRLLYAGLDAIQASVPVELAACLHRVGDEEAQLYVRAPELTTLNLAQTVEITAALREIGEHPELQEATLEVGGYEARALVTGDARAITIWIFGRRGEPIADDDLDLIDNVVVAVGGVAASMAETDFAERWDGIIRLSVDAAEELPRAEVAVAGPKTVTTGVASGASTAEAVANAIILAVNPSLHLAGISDVEVDGADAVVVMLRNSAGRGATGSALAGANPLHAVGHATLEAARALG